MDFATRIALVEAIIGSHGTFEGSRAMLVRWRGSNLVPVGTVIGSCRAYLGSRRAYLALREAVLGSRIFSVVSVETCFSEVSKGTLAMLTFLFLHKCKGLLLPPMRSCSNFS